MLKRKASEVIGHGLFDVFPETQGSTFAKNIAQSIRTKTPLSFEVEFAMAPYENFYEVRVYPLANGITVFCQVITARKQAETAIRESESQFRQLAESLPQPGGCACPMVVAITLTGSGSNSLACQAPNNWISAGLTRSTRLTEVG